MKLILLERIEKLGQMGDVVSVKPGHARNFLLPKGKALRATKANEKIFESQRAQLEARNLEQRGEAESVAGKLDGESFVVIRQAGESGQLYGSVSGRDIASIVSEGGFSVERGQVVLDRPIKELGLHEVRISLHPEVSTSITINVARTEDEAERQARGEDVTQDRFADDDDDDDAISPEEVFEEEAEAEIEAIEEVAAEDAAEETSEGADAGDDAGSAAETTAATTEAEETPRAS